MKKIVIILVLLGLFSCKEQERVVFHMDNCEIIETYLLDNSFTIFCYIHSSHCDPCAMQWLHRWTWPEFRNDLEKLNVGVVLIVQSSDKESIRNIVRSMRLNFPVIFDSTGIIKQNNPAILNQHSVFVINRRKEVVWLGAPLENQSSWDLFRRTLRRHRVN